MAERIKMTSKRIITEKEFKIACIHICLKRLLLDDLILKMKGRA